MPGARQIGDSLVARGREAVATFAEFEAGLLGMRTHEGMAVARAKGKLRGKPPKPTARQQARLVRLHAARNDTVSDLAEMFSVSRATVYRVLERHRAGSGV